MEKKFGTKATKKTGRALTVALFQEIPDQNTLFSENHVIINKMGCAL